MVFRANSPKTSDQAFASISILLVIARYPFVRFGTKAFFLEVVSQGAKRHMLSSRAQREILYSQIHTKKDFSPAARNDNCETASTRVIFHRSYDAPAQANLSISFAMP